MSESTRIFAALVGGVVAGVLGRLVSPAGAEAVAGVVEPIGSLWSNAMRLTVLPLVVASILGVMVRSESGGAAARMGWRVLLAAAGLLLLGAVLSLTLGPPLLDLVPISDAALEALRHRGDAVAVPAPISVSFRDWLVQLIPANPFKALVDGAMLPLVVATIGVGAAARSLPLEKRQAVARGTELVVDVAFAWIRWVLRLAPVGVFALVFAMAARAGGEVVVALASYVLVTAVLCAVVLAALYGLVATSGVIPVGVFARSILSPQLVGFSSRSSQSALPLMIERARAMGLPREASEALLPLLAATFRVTSTIVICIGVVFAAWLYGVELAPDRLVSVGLLSLALSVGMPGVPSAGILITGSILASLGIPGEAIGVLLAIDPIGDMLRSGTNVTGHLALATHGSAALRRPALQ